MVEEVLAVHSMKLVTEDDVLSVRRRVREIAEMRRFDTFAIAAIMTATSELGRNVLVHGGGGSATIEEISDGIVPASGLHSRTPDPASRTSRACSPVVTAPRDRWGSDFRGASDSWMCSIWTRR